MVCTQGVNVCTDFYFNFWLPSHKERNLYICFHLFCNWNGYFNYIKEIVKCKNFSLTNIIAMAFDLKGVCRIHGLITDYIKTIYYVRKLSSSFCIYIYWLNKENNMHMQLHTCILPEPEFNLLWAQNKKIKQYNFFGSFFVFYWISDLSNLKNTSVVPALFNRHPWKYFNIGPREQMHNIYIYSKVNTNRGVRSYCYLIAVSYCYTKINS